MMSIIEVVMFLERCIAEDQKTAERAREWTVHVSPGERLAYVERDNGRERWRADLTPIAAGEPHGRGPHWLRHIERWQPERVIADCEAKRRIVRICSGEAANDPDGDGFTQARARHTLRLLTLSFTDRPGYDPAWQEPGFELP